MNRSLPIADVTTLSDQVDRSVVPRSLIAQLSSFFGLLAVFLACIGLYGLMACAVSKRTNEIGIRLALGAARSSVRWLVMREALLLVSIGLAIGVPIALASDRVISSMLFGLGPTDPLSILAALGLTLAVAALAGYIPARRATKVDPIEALRYE